MIDGRGVELRDRGRFIKRFDLASRAAGEQAIKRDGAARLPCIYKKEKALEECPGLFRSKEMSQCLAGAQLPANVFIF
jgi:hypothetical protein